MGDPTTNPRRELAAVMVLTAIGAAVRLWAFGRLGLTHFDEGIYALAGLWVYSPKGLAGLDPVLISYAPPGFPILVGLCYALAQGPSDSAAIAVAEACGILAIPVAAWLGRRAFGPGAGAATAAFAALSGPHVSFSRMAMTDTPFLLAWMVALGLGGRFLERPRLGRALALGLAVGVAQYLKYNGWLAGAIVGLAAWPVLLRERREAARTLSLGFVAAIVASGMYLPWFQFVEGHGGYASLMAHHRGYLGGVDSWLPHWRSQLAQAVALSGGRTWGLAAWTLAWFGGTLVLRRPPAETPGASRDPSRFLVGWFAGAAALMALPDLPWWIALGWTPWSLRAARPDARVLGISVLVLSVLTPFYHPYARLWLPLHSAGWLVLGGLVVLVWGMSGAGSRDILGPGLLRGWRGAWAGAVVLAFGLQHATGPRAFPLPGLLEPTDELRQLLDELVPPAQAPSSPTVLHSLARPPVTFYLAGRVAIRHYPDLKHLLRVIRDQDTVLIDEGLLRPGELSPEILSRFRQGRSVVITSRVEVNLPTALDEDPGIPFKVRETRPKITLDFVDPSALPAEGEPGFNPMPAAPR